jgi:AcrR family transcriptional regulator
MGNNGSGGSRAERRRESERRILEAARGMFRELGYERTTIRLVAREARIDPAVVMQYFGDKENLFRQAVKIDSAMPESQTLERLTEQLLDSIGVKLTGMPMVSLTMLRSMLTRSEVAAEVREALHREIKQVAEAVSGDDAQVRASLLIAVNLGVVIGKHLLELEPLRSTEPEKIVSMLRPAMRALADAPAEAVGTRPGAKEHDS